VLPNRILTSKFSAHDDGAEMIPVVTLNMNQFAWYARLNVTFYAFRCNHWPSCNNVI
jgi:hypothetical protein